MLSPMLPAGLAESLWEAIAPDWPGFSVELLPEIDSTNTELMRRARAGRIEPVLLVAERQTAGRGRMGRAWTSAPGDSLTLSIGVPLAPAQWAGLSLAVGVTLAEQLQALGSEGSQKRIAIKWPNDLWLAEGTTGRKLAGILVETAGAVGAAAPRYVVVGIGINLATPSADGLSTPPAGLREVVPEAQATQVLGAVVPPLMHMLLRFERDGFVPWQPRFAARDALRGQPVRLSDGRQGVACGVDADGALLVHTAGGMEVVSSSEVSVRPRAGGA